ncbi:MAG: 3-mercaptopyruvate sulfurtransferase [Pseudomonadota bacterium]
MESLVTTDWLAKELGASDLRVVDATKFMGGSERDARAEYEAGHIPSAVFMDLADLVDPSNAVENMAPKAEKFASRMQSLGLGDGSRIVLYDDSPLASASRAWWLLKLFGAHDVALLDGGLAKWKAEGRALEMGNHTLRHRHFTVWRDAKAVRTKAQMLANVESKAEQVVDARPAARFTGEERDPRPGVAPGHIPGSRCVPLNSLFNADGTWKQGDALLATFSTAGIDPAKPLITTCGSGMTASAVAFAAHLLGHEDVALYDGSWTEWGADPATPKATGAA